ncbi:MAG: T9SS type A sorting domain-containing protein [Bacteroidetes bacterium]|nr:T9SS type A sorting domain-containing protein [Bacteroidota bacterium]
MQKYLLLLLALISVVVADSQNVFNSGDPVINYNASDPLGSATHPNTPTNGVMSKWIRTRNTSRIPWDDTKFKAYYWNGMAFRLRYPQNYDSTKKYPMIIFFHGGGEIGPITENEDHLYWGASMFQDMIVAGQFNAFMLFPQQTSVGWDASYMARVVDILDTLTKYKGMDPDRVITMGLSEGGYGAISMASLYPGRVASIIASSPIDALTIGNMSGYIHVPLWVGNGGQDTNPRPDVMNNYVDTFHTRGGDIFQTYVNSVDHVMWSWQWGMQDQNKTSIVAQYWNAAHKAQPLLFYQNSVFCQGKPFTAKMGITAGYNAYQWQRGVNGVYSDIIGANSNEYTATQPGYYRVHFKRTSTSDWSDWTPNPIRISTKPCSLDTLFTENFNYDDPNAYQYFAPSAPYKRYNYDCDNGLYVSGTENFAIDATGKRGSRFSLNYTASGTNCTLSSTGKVWGTYLNYPTVKPNTNYLLSFYVGNQTTSSPRASLYATANGTTLTNLLTKPTALPSSLLGHFSWTKFTYLWNSGFNTSVDLSLYNNSTNTSGNDFALDEISLTRQLAPGGIGGNMALWAKADVLPLDDSTRLFDWGNASGATPLTQASQSNKPILRNNASDNINFNPLVHFNTANDRYMLGSGGYAGTGTYSAAHVFIVGRTNNNTQNDSVLIERAASSTRVAVSLPNGGNVIWDAGATSGGSHLTTPFLAADVNKPLLWSFSKDNVNNTGSGFKQDIRKNGQVIASSTATTASFTGNNSDFKIGSSDERIAEVIYYLGANINAASQNRIESYLATKYGITLGSTANPVSYVASDGTTTFWPGNAIFQNDVFGIGIDSLSGLAQLQSNSMNSGSGDGTGQTGKGNLILTSISTMGDKNFLMIGNDAATLAEHIILPGEAPSVVQTAKRVGREWKVENTNAVGPVTLTFDTTGLTLSGGAVLGNFALLIDNDGDGDFNTGVVSLYYATSSNNKQLNFSGVTLNDNVAFTIITQKSLNSLPATWLGFTAENVNGNAVLNWKTSEEINVDYYAVEHSTDGRNFTVIGTKAANNSLTTNNYTYTHQSLAAGIHYYRIRRVDRDGVYGFSEVKTVKISGVSAVQLRPNPVVGSTLTLAVSMQQRVPTTIQIVSVDGKVMMKQNTQLQAGLNTIDMNVSNLPTGFYLVQLIMSDEVVTKKFIRAQ